MKAAAPVFHQQAIRFIFLLLLPLLVGVMTVSPLQAIPAEKIVVRLSGDVIRRAPPVAADLNGDGDKEIVVGGIDGMLYVLAYQGGSWSTVWERQTAEDINAVLNPAEHQADGLIGTPVSIADIDADGKLEIVVTTGDEPNSDNPSSNRHGAIIVYEKTGLWSFEVKPGWPIVMPDTMGMGAGGSFPDGVRDGIASAPSLGDLDNDGDLEIVSMTFDRLIRAYHHNGVMMDGWPISRANGDPILRSGSSTAAIGDIDNDGLNEVVIGTSSPPWNGDDRDGPFPSIYDIPDYSLATLWALNGDSTLVAGFPVITEQVVKSSPSLGDIDGDGDLEIVVGTGDFPGYVNGHQVYAWHGDGRPVSGWPRPTAGNMLSSPALADLDGDNVLDVIIGCGALNDPSCSKMYAWHGSGANVSGFPVSLPYTPAIPPVVADIDGDGRPEIVQTSNRINRVMILQHNGAGLDTSRTLDVQPWSSPLVDDVDNDGQVEIVVAAGTDNLTRGAIFIYDESAALNPTQMFWPNFHQNEAHSGILQLPRIGFADEVFFYHQTGSGNGVQLTQYLHNAGGGELSWSLNTSGTNGDVSANPSSGLLQAGEYTAVTLNIDLQGYSADAFHNLGNLLFTATSSGLPVANTPLEVPVRVYIGDISQVFIPIITR